MSTSLEQVSSLYTTFAMASSFVMSYVRWIIKNDPKLDPSSGMMVLGEGEKLEVACYTIVINPGDYDRWRAMINQGKSLPPELISMLIGRAKPQHILIKKA